MTILLVLLALGLVAGTTGLCIFLWALRAGQYDDLDGAANRILFDETRPSKPSPVPNEAARCHGHISAPPPTPAHPAVSNSRGSVPC